KWCFVAALSGFWLHLPVHDAAAGPRVHRPSVHLPLYRPWRGARKVYVEATLPDGHRALFLVDTGADRSVLQRDIAQRLKLPVAVYAGLARGLGAEGTVDLGRWPWIPLGGHPVQGVAVAVGVPGLQPRQRGMPGAGILGMNVWSRSAVQIARRADRITLSEPG